MFGIEAKLHLEIKPKAYMYTPENKEISLTPLLHATSGNLLTIDKMRGLLLRSVTYWLCWGWHGAQRSDLVQKPPSSLEMTGSKS